MDDIKAELVDELLKGHELPTPLPSLPAASTSGRVSPPEQRAELRRLATDSVFCARTRRALRRAAGPPRQREYPMLLPRHGQHSQRRRFAALFAARARVLDPRTRFATCRALQRSWPTRLSCTVARHGVGRPGKWIRARIIILAVVPKG